MNGKEPERKSGTLRFILVGTVLIIAVVILLPRCGPNAGSRRGEMSVVFEGASTASSGTPGIRARNASAKAPATPEEIVASKVSQFGRSRREICFGLARKHGVEVPDEVERFFDAVEAANWDAIESIFDSLWKQFKAKPAPAALEAVWSAIHDAFGAAEQAQEWPAQKLLNYGDAILGSLKPGMVYVGGTDPGRFVPALLNGAEGDPRVVITQNALADPKYLEYVQFVYGDRFAALAPEDSRTAQLAYLQDARKRLDQNQLRPGEDVRLGSGEIEGGSMWSMSGFTDGEVRASGQVAVMAVNERLMNKLLEMNPSLSFALEESFPLNSVNAGATTLGPILQLRAEEQQTLTQQRAAESVAYWKEQTQQLLADPEFLGSDYAKKTYSKLVSTHGALLAGRSFTAEAEEAFRFANQLCPYSPEAVFRYVNLLVNQQRFDEARGVANNAIAADPANQQFQDLRNGLTTMKKP